ncbi:S41 family peptidase [Patescibacteria group bacterium]|nr:S41 family peptidase [Patescibacteria group bacterium]MCL5091804.1 S41 family peptidase [Patescibacteria group bacterium]
MKSHRLTNILLGLCFVVLVFGSGYKLGEYQTAKAKIDRQAYNILNAATPANQNVKNIDFSLFWDTWDKVEQKFVDKKKLDPQKMFYGAIKGMVASLDDPYTFFLTPQENQQSKDDLNGKFEGIGAQLGLKDNRITVIAPLKNSPAQKAGVETGDIITAVDGAATKGWTLIQAVNKIRGPKGTQVKLTLERTGKTFTVSITRDVINVASVEVEFENDLGYIKINQFGENTNDEWDRAVDQVKQAWDEHKIKGLILDVRDNPGGYLESSVYIASEFLKRGQLVVKQESTGADNRDYLVERDGRLLTIPLVVLINKGSASASEILSGALRDHGRAQLVGEKSFGKGSVQEALDLKNGAGLHVTIAKWILPNGDWINSKGIEPNIKVENSIPDGNTLTKDNDLQLKKAIELLTK